MTDVRERDLRRFMIQQVTHLGNERPRRYYECQGCEAWAPAPADIIHAPACSLSAKTAPADAEIAEALKLIEGADHRVHDDYNAADILKARDDLREAARSLSAIARRLQQAEARSSGIREEVLEEAAKWHDECAAYADRQVKRAGEPVNHPFQMAEKIDATAWALTRKFYANSATTIRALKVKPPSTGESSTGVGI